MGTRLMVLLRTAKPHYVARCELGKGLYGVPNAPENNLSVLVVSGIGVSKSWKNAWKVRARVD